MKRLLFGAAFMACAHYGHAQSVLTGRIIDQNTNAPIAGATISYGGKNYYSAADGSFSIACTGNGRVTISHIGYTTFFAPVKDCSAGLSVALEPASQTLSSVEITATSASDRQAISQPRAITKLAPLELQRSTGLFLDDAINANVPGVQMQRRGVSSGQVINIRGYGTGVRGTNGTSSNFDIQGIKVYLNGIPLTDAEGITTLDDIDFGSIGSAEILKGPAGTLYGTAIAGAVNLRTVRPEAGKTSIGQQVLIGSSGLERYTTTFQQGGQRSAILLNYGHQESKGYTVHNASRKDFVNFVGEFNPNDRQAISMYAGFSNSYDQRAGELTIGQYDTLNWSGNPAYIKNDAHSHVLSARLGVTHTYRFSPSFSNSTTLFGTGVMNDASSAGGWTDKTPVNFGLRSTFQTRFSLGRSVTLEGITGVESLNQRAQVIGYPMVPDSANVSGYNRVGAARSNVVTKTGNTSAFTQWTLGLPQAFSITAGIGWSQQLIELTDRFYVAANNRPNNRPADVFRKNYDGLWAPSIAVNKMFAGRVSVYASYSTGYKAPVSGYFYIPFVTGAPGTGLVNPFLKPEKGTQFEVGTKGTLAGGRFSYEAAYFHTGFKDKMTTIAVAADPNTTAYSYVTNGGRQVHNGIEAALRGNVVHNGSGFFTQVTPFANLTWIDGKYENFRFQRYRVAPNQTKDSTIDYSGKKVAGLPPVVFTVGLDVITRVGLYANAYYNHRDEVYLTSDNVEKQKGNAFGLLNARIGFRRPLGRHFDLDAYAGGTNLTGEKYFTMVFINQLPDAYIPAPLKAQWFGGINLKYNF